MRDTYLADIRRSFRNYRKLGGPAELLVIRGKGHEEVPEFFECAAVPDFFMKHALCK